MRKMTLLLLALATTAFVGCSKDDGGNSAVDKDGLCTQATIDAFNDVATKASRLRYSTSTSDLQGAKSSCNNFKSLIGGKSCKALDRTTGTERMVDGTSRNEFCNEVDRLLQGSNGNDNQVQTQPRQNDYCSEKQVTAYNYALQKTVYLNQYSTNSELSDTERACESFKSSMGYSSCQASVNNMTKRIDRNSLDLSCSLVDTYKALQNLPKADPADEIVLTALTGNLKITALNLSALKDDTSIFAYQEGKAFEYGADQALNLSKPYCLLVSTKLDIKNNETIFEMKKAEFNEAENHIKMTDDLDETSLTEIRCYNAKDKSAKDLKVADLKSAFKTILKIESVK